LRDLITSVGNGSGRIISAEAMNAMGCLLEDLTRWVLSVDRRLLVMKALESPGAFNAADIAERSGRSVQNISRAIHELEEKGLIECITPDKHTWKRYLLTESGRETLSSMHENNII
jgi:DNA-binding MarR family transcriptional regulator